MAEIAAREKPRLRGPMADIVPPKVGAEAYAAASWSHPDVRGWAPSQGSADSDLLPELATIVRRSRDLERNHGVAGGARQTVLDNVLGCGLWLAPTPDYTVLGKDRKWASAWRKPVKAKWRLWAETAYCDAGETLTLDGLATVMFNGAWLNGESLALPLWLPTPSYPAATRLQTIEADRLSNPQGRTDGPNLRGGVTINEYGAPQGYWIRNAHPGERFIYADAKALQWTLVPAYTSWGRRRVIHAYDPMRAGQRRGVPALAGVLHQFKVLGDYQRAELKSAVVNAMVALITESSIGQEGLVELLSSNPDALSKYVEGLNSRGRSAINFSEGLVLPLILGEKVAGFTPARPSTAYEPFVTTVFRHIATGLNLPYELLMKDFSKTNYSSARAALLEAWRFFIGRRNWLAQRFYQAAYELWLEEMVNAGEIEAPDFYVNKAAYCRARWIGPGRGWVDPLKEAQAADLRMKIFVSSLEDECAEQGKDWEEVLEQVAEEEARLQELKLTRAQVQQAITPQNEIANDGEGSDQKASDAYALAQQAAADARAAVQQVSELSAGLQRALARAAA
jgi:lambda family phage portal protein